MIRKDLRETQLVRWNAKDETLISRYVQKYMDILRVSDGQVQTAETVKLDVYRRILSHYIELEGVTNLENKMGLLFRSAFLRLKKYKKQDIYMLRRALAAEIRRGLKRPMLLYSVLFPLHAAELDLKEDKTLQIMGSEIRLTTWDKILQETGLKETLQKPLVRLQDLENDLFAIYLPTMVTVEACDEYEAYENGLNVFEQFRSVLNLLSKSGQYSIHHGHPSPIATYLSGPIHVIFDDEGAESLNAIESRPSFIARKNTISMGQLEQAESFSNDLTSSKVKNSTREMLVDAIRRYGNALETTEWPIAFLNLWQVLELISLSNPGDQNTTKRIKTLLTKGEYHQDLIDVLQQSRNDLVHRGIFPGGAGHLEVQMLKLITDKAIFSLWEMRDSLPTVSGLREFYGQASLSDPAIDERINTLKFIREGREK